MLIKKNKRIEDEEGLSMTPMIDIVFQLLIFFLLSAKFIALEGQLASYLPKDKGLDQPVEPLELVQVDLNLYEEGDEKYVCHTFNYRGPGGERKSTHKFDTVDGTKQIQYQGTAVELGYVAPDFAEIEEYLRYRKNTFEDPEGKGLPVNVSFEGKVPVQIVVTILDICTRLKIDNFTLMAREID